MSKTKLASMSDQLEWDTLNRKKENLKKEIASVDEGLKAVATRTFTHYLSKGKWKVIAGGDEYSNFLDATDSDTEQVLVEVASVLFDLGYHDEFYLQQGSVCLRATVDDGAFRIYIHAYGDDMVSDCKILNLDVDLSAILKDRVSEALQEAYNEYNRAAQKVAFLEASLGIPITAKQ